MKSRIAAAKLFLKISTSTAIIEWPTIVGVISLSVFIHVLASIDVGFEQVITRILLSALAVAPMFLLIKLSLLMKIKQDFIAISLVLSAIVIGGVFRGFIIQSGLEYLQVESRAITNYRVSAGIVISLAITLITSYTWATVKEARIVLLELRKENAQLQSALSALEKEARFDESQRALELLDYIKNQVESISITSTTRQVSQLEQLVNVIIRPVSHSWARNLEAYVPALMRKPEVTLRRVWKSLDPIMHLPSPASTTLIVTVSSFIPAVGTYGRDIAIQLGILFSLTLYLTLIPGYHFARKFFAGPRTLKRDMLLTLLLFLLALPSSFVTVYVLRDTSYPFASFATGLITIPLICWLLMAGNSAQYQTNAIENELRGIKLQLNWLIARINLLSWFQQGVISRLLHGVIQNSIQAGLIRIQGVSDEKDKSAIIESVIQRIENAIRQFSNEEQFASAESIAIAEISKTWDGIAEVNVVIDEVSKKAIENDAASLSITVDLVHELCSNAIRHGSAKQIDFNIETTPNSVVIHMQDNGKILEQVEFSGLGTRFIESCAIQHQSQRIDGRNERLLEIPMGKFVRQESLAHLS